MSLPENRELLLGQEEQLNLTIRLYKDGLFGIKEDPSEFIELKSKRLSPHYLDLRKGISSYATRQHVAGAMLHLANLRAASKGSQNVWEAYDYLAGTPEAFTSYATSVADLAKMGVLQPRVDTNKASGNKSSILGSYKKNASVAEFDDVITDGQSKIDTIQSLGKAGLRVADYFVVVDRQEGGVPQVFEQTGMAITPALSASRMCIMLHAESLISRTQFDNVHEYLTQYGDPGVASTMQEQA